MGNKKHESMKVINSIKALSLIQGGTEEKPFWAILQERRKNNFQFTERENLEWEEEEKRISKQIDTLPLGDV